MDGSSLVQRKKVNGGKTVRQKHVADIVQLVCSIKDGTPLPRILLKNGKRSAEQRLASQAEQSTQLADTSISVSQGSEQREPILDNDQGDSDRNLMQNPPSRTTEEPTSHNGQSDPVCNLMQANFR